MQPGLEAVLHEELGELGIAAELIEGGATFPASVGALHRIHWWGRTATRVWVRLGRFPAVTLDALAQGVRRLPWARFVQPRQPLDVRVTAHSSRLRHRDRVGKKVGLAIEDALRGPSRRPRHGPRPPTAQILVRIVEDVAELSVDASGEALYRRGWRRDVGEAPLRENIAAAVLRIAGWDPAEPLVDPMCGAGTFPIEAATIALGLPAGKGRRFAFESWPEHDAEVWNRFRREPHRGATEPHVRGSDRNERVVRAARNNASRAGVGSKVRFDVAAAAGLERPPGRPGLVVCNPPWGERIKGVRAAWRDLGTSLKRAFGGWRVALLVPRDQCLRDAGLTLPKVASLRVSGLRVAVCVGRIRGSS
ncbi:MAG: class I SAM-dependent RNA methyltransferase [Myxococcota bacterium]